MPEPRAFAPDDPLAALLAAGDVARPRPGFQERLRADLMARPPLATSGTPEPADAGRGPRAGGKGAIGARGRAWLVAAGLMILLAGGWWAADTWRDGTNGSAPDGKAEGPPSLVAPPAAVHSARPTASPAMSVGEADDSDADAGTGTIDGRPEVAGPLAGQAAEEPTRTGAGGQAAGRTPASAQGLPGSRPAPSVAPAKGGTEPARRGDEEPPRHEATGVPTAAPTDGDEPEQTPVRHTATATSSAPPTDRATRQPGLPATPTAAPTSPGLPTSGPPPAPATP